MTMSLMPPHAAADHDKGRDVNRCPNEGCGLQLRPDKGDPRILRCPSACTMRRAKTIEFTQLELAAEARNDGSHAPPEPTRERDRRVG